jgi:hypothetical protein
MLITSDTASREEDHRSMTPPEVGHLDHRGTPQTPSYGPALSNLIGSAAGLPGLEARAKAQRSSKLLTLPIALGQRFLREGERSRDSW